MIVCVTGILFSLPMIRDAQPGIPAIGCTADVVSLMWNIALVSSASLMLFYRYTTKLKTAILVADEEDKPWVGITETPLVGKISKSNFIKLQPLQKYARVVETEEES